MTLYVKTAMFRKKSVPLIQTLIPLTVKIFGGGGVFIFYYTGALTIFVFMDVYTYVLIESFPKN